MTSYPHQATPRRRTLRPALLSLLLVALASTACGSTDDSGPAGSEGGSGPAPAEPLTLTVVSSDWNGWDPDHRPTPETTTLQATVGAGATVEGGVRFEVVDVGDGEVEVEADQQLAPRGDRGGSNMNDLVDEVTVTTGDETRLATATLDAGFSYSLTLGPSAG